MARQHQELEVALGDGIRAQRIEQRLTQDELAVRANVSLEMCIRDSTSQVWPK